MGGQSFLFEPRGALPQRETCDAKCCGIAREWERSLCNKRAGVGYVLSGQGPGLWCLKPGGCARRLLVTC